MSYKIITAPTVEPITLVQAKLYLGVDGSDEDDLITGLIKSARWYCENYLDQKLLTTTMELYLDEFHDLIEIDNGLLQSVETVKYYDVDNSLQTLADSNYDVDVYSQPARVMRSSTGSYPATYDRSNAVIINFKTGYGDAATSVPDNIIAAVYLQTKHLYDTRDNVVIGSQVNEIPLGTIDLLNLARVWRF